MGYLKEFRLWWAVCLMALLVGNPSKLFASHATGADLSYVCLGNNQYKVTLNFYKDCNTTVGPPSSVNPPNYITISSASCGGTFTKVFTQVSHRQVSDVCPAQVSHTTCNGGNLPGIEQYVFECTITLPTQCSDWVISYQQCCRNNAITNLSSPNTSNIYIEARLNNTNGLCDNSPLFTTLPTPYYCAGNLYNYNHGGIDYDGDSLAFKIVQPKTSATANVPYRSGYSNNSPVGTSGGFVFDGLTGQMTFTPSGAQQAVIDVLVEEYRTINGVPTLIGSTMRDMQVVVINCTNQPPIVSGINNSSPTNPSNFQTSVCSGAQLCFDIDFTDPVSTNTVDATWNSGISGGTFTVTNNVTNHAVGHFCWTPTLADVGTHNFTITLKNNNCPLVGTTIKGFTVNVAPANYNLTFTKTNIKCPGGANGTVKVIATGATAPIYQWSNGQSTQTITGLPGGWYKVTVNDNGGCATIDSVKLNEPPPIVDSIGMVPTQCNGFVNGEAFVYSVTGGNSLSGHISHLWTAPVPPTSADTIKPIPSDTYYITFTDDSGCVKNDSVFVTQPGPIVIVATASAAVTYHGAGISCHGKSDGQVAVIVTGGTQPYNYHWNLAGSPSNDTIFNLVAGFYKVTITDANGCNDVATYNLTQPDSLVAGDTVINAFHGYDISCFGLSDGRDSVLSIGGTGIKQYAIVGSAYQPSNVLTGLAAGTYTIVVQDENGCTDTVHNAVVTQPTQLVVTAGPIATSPSGANIACHGGTDGRAAAQVSGGTSGYAYSWDDQYGQMTQAITDLTAGTYHVTVTDTNGCSLTASATLIEPPQMSVAHALTNVSCYGDSNGTATINPNGGAAPYRYTWTNPASANTQTLPGLKADSLYMVIVTDLNECALVDSFRLTQPTALTVRVDVISDYRGRQISCYGGNDGMLQAFATGGTGTYTYAWCPCTVIAGTNVSMAGFSDDTLSNSTAGTYPVIITDANGCTATANNTLVNPPQIVIADSVIKAYHGYDISCFGLSDARDSITLTGGTSPYQYSVQGGTYQLGNVINGLAAGNYTLEVKDANGCVQAKPIQTIVTQPTAVATTINVGIPYTGQNISCFGASDGDATAVPNGGTGTYTYQWNDVNTQITAQATGLKVGNYTVTVSDANGCTITASTTLTQPSQITAAITTFADALCNAQASGTASVFASGGTGAYTYSWNSATPQTTANANSLSAGPYIVTVKDANNCTTTATVTIGQPTAIIPFDSVVSDYRGQQISCYAASDGAAIARASGGTPPYTYQWPVGMGSGIGGAFIGNVKAGSYVLTVTDAHNCPVTAAALPVSQPDPIYWQQTASNDVKCHGERTGSATVQISGGGTSGYTYLWLTDGATTTTNNALPAGNHTVRVTDANNCVADTVIAMKEPDAINFPAIFDTVQCHGLSNATATASATGGVASYYFDWGTNPVKSGTTVSNLAVGVYDVTITDRNNCTTTTTAKIDEPEQMGLQVAKQNPTCAKGPDGFLKATVTGGRPTYQYAWGGAGNSSSDEIQGALAGVYDLTATDNHGCTITTTVAIAEPPADTVTAMPVKDTVTFGQATEVLTTYTTAAQGAVTYEWEPTTGLSCNDCAKPMASPLETTEYTLRMTDAMGCVAVAKTTVNVKDVRPLYIPNAFSPNGDNLNDVFYVYGSGITEMELKVFNRWGVEVFESHDISAGWDGTFNGQKLEPDVYVYHTKVKYLDSTEKTSKGSITLMK